MDHAGEVYHDCASYRGSDGGRGDVPVSFVVRFTDSGPNAVHERVVVGLAKDGRVTFAHDEDRKRLEQLDR